MLTYTIKEMTKKTGLTSPTLRFYEKEEVLPFVQRDVNGNRVYTDENISWIHFILALRSTGMPVKRYVKLYKQENVTIQERRKMMLDHKQKVEADMRQTYKHLEQINYKLALYDAIENNLQNKKIQI